MVGAEAIELPYLVLRGVEEPACWLDGFVSELPGYHRKQTQVGK